jgi:CheW-like domain
LASNRAESFGLIDEMGIVAENGPEGVVMSASAKREERMTSASTSLPSFIITTIGGRYLAFEAEHIQGVLTSENGGFLQDPVVQDITYRVVDLAVRLNLASEGRWNGTEGVLLGDERCRGCVSVQKVHGILEVHKSQILPLPAQFHGPERGWYHGMILFDQTVVLVLNTAWVLEEQLDGVASKTESQGAESIVALQGVIQSKNRAC